MIVYRRASSGVTPKNLILFGREAVGGTTFDPAKPTGAFATYAGAIGQPALADRWRDTPGTDLNADGLTDIFGFRFVGGETQYGFVPGRRGTATVDGAATFERAAENAPLGDFKVGPLLSSTYAWPVPTGDLDGDGTLDGIAAWPGYAEDSTDPEYPRGAFVLYTDGPDRVAPVLAPRVPQAADPTADIVPGFTPAAFKAGTGASLLRAQVQEDLPLTLTWKTATGRVLKTETVGRKLERPFDGAIDGKALAAGRYDLEVSATDAAGNRGVQTLPFEILPGGTNPDPEPVAQTVGPLSEWKTNGAAKQLADGSVELTSATPTTHGEVYWPIPITQAVPTTTVESRRR